jgi:hypothetical protein
MPKQGDLVDNLRLSVNNPSPGTPMSVTLDYSFLNISDWNTGPDPSWVSGSFLKSGQTVDYPMNADGHYGRNNGKCWQEFRVCSDCPACRVSDIYCGGDLQCPANPPPAGTPDACRMALETLSNGACGTTDYLANCFTSCVGGVCQVAPTPTAIPTPTSIPPPVISCSATFSGINWSWNTWAGITDYWLQVWGELPWPANDWGYTSPTFTGGTPGVTYSGQVAAGDGTQTSPWSNTTSCTVPIPLPPTPSCDNAHFNSDGTAKTPIIWSWTDGAAGLQSKDNSFTNPIGGWWYNASAISPLTINGIRPGPPNVCGRTVDDWYGGNWHSFSSENCISCPLPANKTTVISGVLRQKSGTTGCYQADASNNFKISSINATTPDNCVTATCSTSPNSTNATAYSCTVTYDNQACVSQGRQPDPSQLLTLNIITSNGYDAGQFSDSSCNLGGKQLSINAGANNSSADVAFNFSGTNWLKTKDTSFINSSTTSVTIPMSVHPFPASNDTGSPYFIIGQAGSALFNSGDAGVSPDTKYSDPRNWHAFTSHGSVMNPGSFISYIKSRKTYQSISDLANINADGIYVWTGADININNGNVANFNGKKVVLISLGTVNISVNSFAPTSVAGVNPATAIIAGTINFLNTTKAQGIFIGNTVTTDTQSYGLQIIGNLIAIHTFTNNRSWSDTSIPSIFVDFDSNQYINLLPYLSTASYDWRQIQ